MNCSKEEMDTLHSRQKRWVFDAFLYHMGHNRLQGSDQTFSGTGTDVPGGSFDETGLSLMLYTGLHTAFHRCEQVLQLTFDAKRRPEPNHHIW